MPSKLFALFYSIAFLLPACLYGTTYYLDNTNGSDTDPAHDGLSPATAWKSIAQIATAVPQPGDVFLFKRGEEWQLTSQWYITYSGTQAAPITFGAYGDVNDDLPIITNVGEIANANVSTNWTESMTNNIWTFPLAATPGRLFLDGTEYLRASTLADVGTTDSEGIMGYWFFDGGNLYIYASENPATLYSSFQGSHIFYPTLLYNTEYLNFEDLDFRGGTGSSFAILGGSHTEIRNCRLGHSGNTGILLLNATVDDMDQSTSNITIEDNTFDSNFTFFYGLGSERGCGDGLRLRRGVSNCTIANNTFINWAHNAIELLGDDAAAGGVNNNQIHDNHISAPDIPYAHPLGADGLIGKCQQNEFYRNYIENCRTASQINGNDNWVHHNIISGMRRSPAKNDATAHAFILAIYGAGLVSENNRFDHNLIVDTDESAFLVRGYGHAGQVENNSIRNNIIYDTGKAPYGGAYQSGTGLVINDIGDGVGGNTYQNNLFYSSFASAPVFTAHNTTYLTSSAFNALDGTEGNTISDNLSGDPLFTDLVNENYLPMDNSPAVNRGIDVGLTLDYDLQPRFVGPAPDIGPLETDVTTPLPVEWGGFWLEVVQQQVILQWQTLTEIHADHFTIERSKDGISFDVIGEVPATGYSTVPRDYRFRDADPPTGKLYYRLRQVDLDGTFEYSTILSTEILREQHFQLIRSHQNELRIAGPLNWDWGKTRLLIFDQSGKKCMEVSGTAYVSLDQLPSAAYILVLRNGGSIETFRFVK